MAKLYCIYAHINKINNKVYIGQTCNIKTRWSPISYKNSSLFYNAIQKYGWDNFDHIILESNISIEEIDEKEKEYIKKYKSTNRLYGYNILNGGNSNHILSKETKQKISESNKKFWKAHPEYAKKRSQKGCEASKRKVICLNNNMIFNSQIDAAKYANLKSSSGIQKCCKGERKSAGKDPYTNEKLSWAYYNEIKGEDK